MVGWLEVEEVEFWTVHHLLFFWLDFYDHQEECSKSQQRCGLNQIAPHYFILILALDPAKVSMSKGDQLYKLGYARGFPSSKSHVHQEITDSNNNNHSNNNDNDNDNDDDSDDMDQSDSDHWLTCHPTKRAKH